LHSDKDENIKRQAYFAEFRQTECVYFTINETSNKQVYKNLNNMVPMLQKKQYGPNVIQIRLYIEYLQYIYVV